jgi:uncharacterized damage-inducible protein DinB
MGPPTRNGFPDSTSPPVSPAQMPGTESTRLDKTGVFQTRRFEVCVRQDAHFIQPGVFNLWLRIPGIDLLRLLDGPFVSHLYCIGQRYYPDTLKSGNIHTCLEAFVTTQRFDVVPVAGLEMSLGLLLAMLDDSTRNWREELGEVSEDTIVWQPVADGHSIGALLLHITDVEAFWIQEVADGVMRSKEELALLLSGETQQYEGLWPAPPRRPLAWYFAQHAAIRARTHKIVRRLKDPDHIGRRVRQNREAEFTLRWLLYHVLRHEAYHGGQAVLLALMYAKSPT